MQRVTVGEVMTGKPARIRQDATLDEALDIILREGVQDLYVVDENGRLTGILPDYELLKAQLTGVAGSGHVESLMTRLVKSFSPEMEIGEAARLFRDCRYTRVAVVRDGRLIGQISRGDVLRSLVQNRGEGQEKPVPQGSGGAATTHRPRFLEASCRIALSSLQS